MDGAGASPLLPTRFADWFDHAELPIPEGSALERYLTDTIESYMESNQVR